MTSNPRTESNVTANIAVTAAFAINTFSLVYAAGEHGTLTGTTNQTVDYGASGSAVTAVPAEHYHFVSWSDGSTANPRTDSAVKANLSVTASFAIDTFALSYIAGAHGALSGETSQTIEYGASGSTVTAVPDDHYHFVAWSDGGAANPRTDTEITENLTITANFSIDTFSLTYTPGKYGSLTGPASQTVDYGASGSEVAAVPDAGCKFLSWNDGSTANPRVDSGVARDIAVTANFVNIVSYVTPDGAGDNSGDSWGNAIPGKDLKSAIANTASEQIWVAAGTYKPNDANPSNVSRAQSFTLRNKLAVYGGFAGTETDTAQRDIAAHPSVLSGEIGKSGDFDNCQHVLRTSGLDASAILDGFTITGGNAGYDNVSVSRLPAPSPPTRRAAACATSPPARRSGTAPSPKTSPPMTAAACSTTTPRPASPTAPSARTPRRTPGAACSTPTPPPRRW